MLNKSSRRLNKKPVPFHRSKQARFLTLATLGLIAAALFLEMIVGRWNSFGAQKLNALAGTTLSAPTIPPPANPSKEYIYAGDKLIATEEPNPAVTLAAPTLNADTLSGSRIDLTWAVTPGADHYEVERRSDINLPWTALSTSVATTNYPDTTVSSINAYLYRVRAVDSFGNVSPYSNVDVSTAIAFTDNPLIANSTRIKSDHIIELRQAVTAVRATVNLPAFNWTDNLASLSGIKVKAKHVEELRTALDEALTALGLPVSAYSDSGPAGLAGVPIRKSHIEELRQRVK